VEAWARVDVADAQLAIVGPDMPGHALDAGAEARRVVAARGLADAVRFVGPTDDPAFALGAADLFVQPSHYEAFGLSALEALASGLPVVATEVGGLPDFVRNGVNGALAPPQAPERLAQILSGLLKSPERVSRLAAGARRTAVAEFSEEIVASRFARLLEVLAAPRAS
jgi:glycosyltransferase involved in cell wall biosynthesis